MSETREVVIRGALVRAAREQHGWTQGELAYHASVDQSQISKIESGSLVDCKLSTAKRLAIALEMSLDKLANLPVGGEVEVTEGTHTHHVSRVVDQLLHDLIGLPDDTVLAVRAYIRLLKEELAKRERGGGG